MTWHIRKQEEHVGKGEFIDVDCKKIQFIPIKEHGKVVSFRPLRFQCFKVILKHDVSGGEVSLTLSRRYVTRKNVRTGEAETVLTVVYTVINPSRTVPQYLKIGGRQVVDTLKPKVQKKGDSKSFATVDSFSNYMTQRFGDLTTAQVLASFEDRLMALAA